MPLSTRSWSRSARKDSGAGSGPTKAGLARSVRNRVWPSSPARRQVLGRPLRAIVRNSQRYRAADRPGLREPCQGRPQLHREGPLCGQHGPGGRSAGRHREGDGTQATHLSSLWPWPRRSRRRSCRRLARLRRRAAALAHPGDRIKVATPEMIDTALASRISPESRRTNGSR